MKRVSIAGLLAAAGLWSHITPYEIVIRFFRRLAARPRVTTTVPFVASLAWRKVKLAHND